MNSNIEPIPISEHMWQLIRRDMDFREYEIKTVAGVTIHLVSCGMFKNFGGIVPVYIQPKLNEKKEPFFVQWDRLKKDIK
jgi:hypothetical protein